VDDYGFLVTPYQKLEKRPPDGENRVAPADQEHEAILAPADSAIESGKLAGETIIARHHGDFSLVPIDQVQYIDIAPSRWSAFRRA